jgi:hypothetical protein
MLFDPKWDKAETKADPYKLQSLISWLEMKPATGEYNWRDVDGCLLCQYLQEVTGAVRPAVENGGFGSWTITDWGDGGYFGICGVEPHTFGAALSRARALLAAGKSGDAA